MGDLIVPDTFMYNIGDIFRMMLRLRRMLFLVMFMNRTMPEFSTASVLLIHSSMRYCIVNSINN